MTRFERSIRVLALLAAVAVVAETARASDREPWDPKDVKEIKKTVPLKGGGRVSVESFKGSITVSAWDRDEVDIVARIEPGDSGSEEREKVRDTEVEIREGAGTVMIRSDYDEVKQHHSSWFGGTLVLPYVHYTIKAPKGADLRVRDHKSNVSVEGLSGDVDVNSYKGTIAIRGVEGEIEVETYKGEARVEPAGKPRRTRLESYKGEVDLILPKGAAFDLDADVGRKGSLDSDFSLGGTSSRRRGGEEELRGPVNGGGPKVSIQTYKGSFRIREKR